MLDRALESQINSMLCELETSTEELNTLYAMYDLTAPHLLRLLIRHPNCSKSILDKMLSTPHASAFVNEIIPLASLTTEELAQWIDWHDQERIAAIVKSPNCSYAFVSEVLSHPKPEIRAQALKSALITSEDVERLSKDKSRVVLQEVAAYTQLPERVQIDLFKRNDEAIDLLLANNSSLVDSIQMSLYRRYPYNRVILSTLADNPALSTEMWDCLISIDNGDLLKRLMNNPTITLERLVAILQKLETMKAHAV